MAWIYKRLFCWFALIRFYSSMDGAFKWSVKEIQGFQNRKNLVLKTRSSTDETSHAANSCVIFFGGDCQDLPEAMVAHRDNKQYVEWNLVNTLKLLHDRFPSSVILIVKPTRMHLGTFAQYANFVPSNQIGVPNFDTNFYTITHLRLLVENALAQWYVEDYSNGTAQCPAESETYSETCFYCPTEIHMVGFSKGCVVLNQILYDLQRVQQDLSGDSRHEAEQDINFIKLVKTFYWLDSGHSGGKDTWITDKSVLASFAKLLNSTRASVEVHVTPYQIEDSKRPWFGREEKRFVAHLRSLNVNLSRTFYPVHNEEEVSIQTHFSILRQFKEPARLC